MAGETVKYRPVRGYDADLSQLEGEALERAIIKRQRWIEVAEAERDLVRLERFREYHQKAAASFFYDKFNFVDAMIEQVRNPDGSIDPNKVAAMKAKDKKVLLSAFEQIEKVAGFQDKVTTHKHEHKHTLADQFKKLSEGDGDVIDAEVVDE